MTPHDATKLLVGTSMKNGLAFDRPYLDSSATIFGMCLRVLIDRGDVERALRKSLSRHEDGGPFYCLQPKSDLMAGRKLATMRLRSHQGAAQARRRIDGVLDSADPAPCLKWWAANPKAPRAKPMLNWRSVTAPLNTSLPKRVNGRNPAGA